MTRSTPFQLFWISLGVLVLSYEVHLLMIGQATLLSGLTALLWAFVVISNILIISSKRHHHYNEYEDNGDTDTKVYWHCAVCVLTWRGEYEGEPIKSNGTATVYCILHDRPITHIMTQPIDKPYIHGRQQEVPIK